MRGLRCVAMAVVMVVGAGVGPSGAAMLPEGAPAAMAADKPLQNDPTLAGTERFEKGAKEVTEVNLDRRMLAMAAQFLGKDDADAKRLMAKMDFVYVRNFSYATAGGYRMEEVAPFRDRMEASRWSHMIRNRSATESTDIWVREDDAGAFSELVVIAAEPQELTFVHLKGKMTIEELTKAGASYGVPQAGTAVGKGGK